MDNVINFATWCFENLDKMDVRKRPHALRVVEYIDAKNENAQYNPTEVKPNETGTEN